jgi:ABC-2 type transport system ATP-binding protein
MAAIQTEELTKDYFLGFWRPKPYRALDHLTLSVDEGEVFGFLGPNGAGKSTTLKLLMGLLFPTSGSARILGKPLGDAATRRHIGFLPENPYFYDYLTAEELLTYYAGLCGFRGPERTRRVGQVLDDVAIGPERRMRLRSFSKGMTQRVGVAQAIIAQPALVILDEPMSGLDPLGRRHVRQLMLRLRDHGTTVFFSSHILSDAETLCSRVGIIAQGRLMADGRLADMLEFALRGWELIVSHLPDALRSSLEGRATAIKPLPDARYAIELGPGDTPDDLLCELSRHRARVESLNPIRTTLEEYFVSTVQGARPRETGAITT